jgi:hypothetical protein
MPGWYVLGTLEVRVPLPEVSAKEALSKLLPPSEEAWSASTIAKKAKGVKTPGFMLAYRDPDNSIVIVYSGGEKKEKVLVTALDIRIEPGSDISARRATESAWRKFIDANDLVNGGYAPRLELATVRVTPPGQNILEGRPSTLKDVLQSPEFRLPTATGLAAVFLLAIGWLFLPIAEKPSAWWTVAQLVVPAAVAIVLALTLKSKERITWEVK